METTEKNIEFTHPPWLEKGKCNNNNIFEDKGNLCHEVGEANSARCQCHHIQQQQIPVLELPSAESCAVDEAGGGCGVVGLQTSQVEATNGTRFNEDEDELLSTALAAHSPPNSNRTSVNNSTDNLSYNSDNYYVDELIVLQNTLSDEEVSLNSDDCIYAYRGGAEFDITLETRNNNVEDETDFLEMDFDPDPSSEVDPSIEIRSLQYPPSIFLTNCMDVTSISVGGGAALPERQLFSSPIEGGDAALCHRCPTNKDFAKLSLNLTQIQSSSAADAGEDCPSPVTVSCTTDDSKSKVTGAKPKRITERSISMTKNRKNQFLYSKLNKGGTTTSLCSSGSLDERAGAAGFPPLHSANAYTKRDLSDETCLDCLEKEFLANTIGKPIEWSDCPKCKSKRTHHMMAFGHCNSSGSSRSSSSNTGIGVSNSSSVLCSKPPPSSLSFDLNDLIPTARDKSVVDEESANKSDGYGFGVDYEAKNVVKRQTHKNYQRGSSCDNFDGDKHLKRTEKIISTFSTLNADESVLVQALEKLQISYNKKLITSYFQASHPEFKNLKQFILYQSKKNCNYPKLTKLIEQASNGTATAEYYPDKQIVGTEMVQVQVADILHQWTRTNNLELLKQLDKRFIENNILGKITYVIRQAQQRNNAKPLAEYISIPQYYKSGYISVVTKK